MSTQPRNKGSLELRYEALERAYAHQEHLLQTLSDQIYRAFQQIEALQAQIKRLESRREEEEEFGPADEPPPHY